MVANTEPDFTSNGKDLQLKAVKDFRAFAPAFANSSNQVLNVLAIGERGHGKSSWLNTTISTVRQCLTEILHTAPAAGDVTTKQCNLSLEPFSVKMGITDVPGWTSVSNFPTYLRLLRCIVTGRTRDQEALLPITEELLFRLESRPAAPFEKQIHCITVLRTIEDDRKGIVDNLRCIVQEFNERLPVMVLLTKVDRQLPDGATLATVHNTEEFRIAREQLSKDVGLDANRVLPMAAFAGPITYPNVHVEVLVLRALQKAQALAERALQARGRAMQQMAREAGPARSANAGASSVPPPGSAGASSQP